MDTIRKLITFIADKEFINTLITATQKRIDYFEKENRPSMARDASKLKTELDSIKKLIR